MTISVVTRESTCMEGGGGAGDWRGVGGGEKTKTERKKRCCIVSLSVTKTDRLTEYGCGGNNDKGHQDVGMCGECVMMMVMMMMECVGMCSQDDVGM